MADQAADDDANAYLHGRMEIEEQDSTYRAFDGLVRFGGLGIGALVLFLTVLFCTKAGFFGALVPTAILLAAGGFALRKPKPSIDTL